MQLSLVAALPKFSLLQVKCVCVVLRSPLLEEEGPLSLVLSGVSLALPAGILHLTEVSGLGLWCNLTVGWRVRVQVPTLAAAGTVTLEWHLPAVKGSL